MLDVLVWVNGFILTLLLLCLVLVYHGYINANAVSLWKETLQNIFPTNKLSSSLFRNHWLSDINGMSNSLGLFYVIRLRNHVHCTFIFMFFCSCFLKVLFSLLHTVLSNMSNFQTDLFDPYMGPQTDTTTLGQGGPERDGNERVRYITKISRNWASPLIAI